MGRRKPVAICGPLTIVQDQQTARYHVVDLSGKEVWRTSFRRKMAAKEAAQSWLNGDDLTDEGKLNQKPRIIVRLRDGAVFRGCKEAADSSRFSRITLSNYLRTREGHCYLGGEEWEYAE